MAEEAKIQERFEKALQGIWIKDDSLTKKLKGSKRKSKCIGK